MFRAPAKNAAFVVLRWPKDSALSAQKGAVSGRLGNPYNN
jgi:hypothetical protein